MKSYQFRDYGKNLEFIEHLEPSPEGTEVLVRVLACGACHSDVHLWEGEYDPVSYTHLTLPTICSV